MERKKNHMDLIGKAFYNKKNDTWVSITTPEALCEQITNTINYYKNVASECREEANKTRDEVMAEVRDEMQQKDNAISRMSFIFTETEAERYYSFRRKHYSRGCDCNKGFSISFVGDGIGTSYEVICNHCGKREDITDEENW